MTATTLTAAARSTENVGQDLTYGRTSYQFVAAVVLAVIYLNVGTNWSTMHTLMSGWDVEKTSNPDTALRLVREGLIFLLGAQMGLDLFRHKRHEHGIVVFSVGAVALAYMFVAGTVRAFAGAGPPQPCSSGSGQRPCC